MLEIFKLDTAIQDMRRFAMSELKLNASAYDRILKVSRTIADLAESPLIKTEHLAEAIRYRTQDRSLWRQKGDILGE